MPDIKTNSKLVNPGDIFIAINCKDSEQHISEAFKNGARLVFAEQSDNPKVKIVSDARLLVSVFASIKYNNSPNCCVAITGTNGKSSVAHFLRQIWYHSKLNAASLGTLGLFIGDNKFESSELNIPSLTTPDSFTLHKILNYIASKNINHFVFEASSHALDQKRLHSVKLSAAAFTNFASDHMDYHKTSEHYMESKLKLFNEILPNNKPTIFSLDHQEISNRIRQVNSNHITFGLSNKNFISAKIKHSSRSSTVIDLNIGNDNFFDISLKLIGEFQIMNILCACAIAYATGVSIDNIISTLPILKPLTGRMEHVSAYNDADIFVDFAHTADGINVALKTLRGICKGRLFCIFGCGGDRDKSKRSEMGQVANSLADVVIVTDDNPRTEDPASIRKEIIKHCPKAIEIADRHEAIKYAINNLDKCDILVVLGKGHETYQIYGTEKKYFNDTEVILNYCHKK